jgi:hypothetical protein
MNRLNQVCVTAECLASGRLIRSQQVSHSVRLNLQSDDRLPRQVVYQFSPALLDRVQDIGKGSCRVLQGRVWHIDTLGYSATGQNVLLCLAAIEAVRRREGWRAAPGAGVDAALAYYTSCGDGGATTAVAGCVRAQAVERS